MENDAAELAKKASRFILDGNFESALSYLEQAIIKEPNNPDLLNKKGVTLRALGRYDEALECFNRSLQLDPRDVDAS